MRKIISILTLSILFTACKTDPKQDVVKSDGYVIEGTATGVYNGIRAYLETTGDRGRRVPMDTAIVMNGTFKFEGKIQYPDMVYLKVNSVLGDIPLILENDAMTISVDKDNIKNSTIEGSEANAALNSFNEKSQQLGAQRTVLLKKIRNTNQEGANAEIDNLRAELDNIGQEIDELPYEFIKKHKDNVFSVMILKKLSEGKTADYARIESTLNSLSDTQKKSVPATMLNTQIQIKKAEAKALSATQVGKTAPKFSAPNPDGKQLALDDVKGKLTLIDFWASWCKPCRRENPNVVRVYNKYHSKGLEIISVSLDGTRSQRDPKAAWLKAIKDDKLTWNHVSNLKYFNDPVAKSYNIRSIPATFLLDENGIIVAKNLRGAALEQKVAELLN